MKIIPSDLNSYFTQSRVDSIANSLLVNMQTFSEFACFGGALFGVDTYKNNVDTYNGDCNTQDYNWCVRKQLPGLLFSAQASLETELGYDLTKRSKKKRVYFKSGDRVQLSPGLESVGTGLEFKKLESVTVSPYVQQNVTVTQGASHAIATVSSVNFPDPMDLYIWDSTGTVKYKAYKIPGYPIRNGANWEVSLEKNPSTGSDYNAQNSMLMAVDWVHNGENQDEEVYLAYSGTSQKIPIVKTVEVDSNTTRFLIRPWVLIDRAFSAQGASLIAGEFYKLMESVDVVHLDKVAYTPVAYLEEIGDVDAETPLNIYITVIDAMKGIIQIDLKDSCNYENCPLFTDIDYIVDPLISASTGDIVKARRAIAYLAAANLQLKNCECEIQKGFIADAQKIYAEIRINPITGESIANPKYGNREGHFIYEEAVSSIAKIHRPRIM